MNVMVIGSGGREHALCWCLAQSPCVEKIVVVPGNGGTAYERKCKNVSLASCDYIRADGGAPYVQIARHENCTLAVVGPEAPLADGVADEFWQAGISCVGPTRRAAQLEASKDYAKTFMKKYGVAAPRSETFTDESVALAYVKAHGAPVVIKADGLAAGKGVVVAQTIDEACGALLDLMRFRRVGDAGKKVVVEEYVAGVEMSVLAAVSVTPDTAAPAIVPFLPARDHKRLGDGATGPNTGGMGAVCPVTDVPPDLMQQFNDTIVQPTMRGLVAERFDYRGFLFFGVMITSSGPMLLEYNVRLGNPEAQAVLPLFDGDAALFCEAIANGTLADFPVRWKKGCVVSPCVVSAGYPGAYEIGKPILFDNAAIEKTGAHIFVGGAAVRAGETVPAENPDGAIPSAALVTSGGRVLSCSAYGLTFDEAWERAYKAVRAVSFDGAFYRNDIGLPGAAESK
ncbi:MAG: phosphoribosylamine--glycine ligase [Treponema sp.]|nr:phosphoribosylamine--glycine ligase [Treponema sp.]